MEKGEIAHFEQFHLFPQCFPRAFFFSVYKEERVNSFTKNRGFSLAEKYTFTVKAFCIFISKERVKQVKHIYFTSIENQVLANY